jgi:hypothetical protein
MGSQQSTGHGWLLIAVATAFPGLALGLLLQAASFTSQALAAVVPDPPASTTKRPGSLQGQPPGPTKVARADIPLLATYRGTCRGETWRTRHGHRYACWAVLAGVGKVESDHGRSRAPGVRSGVNRFGCCAGPMQFNLRNGPPSTWDTYGRGSPYDPADAIPAARRLLVANGARTDLDGAIWNYNHSWSYVRLVKALARRYQKGA